MVVGVISFFFLLIILVVCPLPVEYNVNTVNTHVLMNTPNAYSQLETTSVNGMRIELNLDSIQFRSRYCINAIYHTLGIATFKYFKHHHLYLRVISYPIGLITL